MHVRPRLALTGTIAALAALALAGCSPTPDQAGPASTSKPKPTASTSADPTDPAGGAATDDPAEATPADCLVGDWVLTAEQMQAFYDQVTADLADYAIVYDPTGTSGLSFRDDGTYAYTPDLTLAVDIAGLPAEATLTGTLSGEYTADGTTLTTSNDANGLTMDVTVDGVAMDGTPVTEQILGSPIQSAAYDCTGDTPVIHFSTGTSTVPLTLARG